MSNSETGHHSLNPMQQFELHKLVKVTMFDTLDLSITNGAVFMLVAAGIAVMIGKLLGKHKHVIPGLFQSFLEMFLGTVKKIVDDNLGHDGKKYQGFVFSLFLFIFVSNLLGLVPYGAGSTSHISVTFALASMVFLTTLTIIIARHGVFFLKVFVPKGVPLWLAPLLFVLEFFSFLIRPVSLSVRLAANMIAGHVMLDVLAFFVIMLGYFGFVPFLFMCVMMTFEFFVAFLQAYIFSVFTCVYINEALHH